MADEGIRVPIGGDATGHNRAVDSATKKAKGFGNVWEEVKGRCVITSGDIVRGAVAASRAMVELAKQGGAYGDALANTRVNVDASAAAVQNLISKLDLVKAANLATESGMQITQERFEALAKAATIYAQKTGGDATQALNQLITALSTGAPETLRRFNISLDAVRDNSMNAEERLTALREQGLDKVMEAFGATKVRIDDLGERIQQSETEWANMKVEVGKFIAESPAISAAFDAVGWVVTNFVEGLRLLGQHWDLVTGKIASGADSVIDAFMGLVAPEIAERARRGKQAVQEAREEWIELGTHMDEAIRTANEAVDAQRLGAETMDKHTAATKRNAAATKTAIDAEEQAWQEYRARSMSRIAAEEKENDKRRAHLEQIRESARMITEALGDGNKFVGATITDLQRKVAAYRADLQQTRADGGIVDPEDIQDLKDAEAQLDKLVQARQRARDAEDRAREQSRDMARQAREAQASQFGIGEVGGGLAEEILGPPGEFEMRMSEAAIAIGMFGEAWQAAGAQMASANIGILMDRAIGQSVQYVHANKKAAESSKAMQLSTAESMKAATRDILKTIATQAAVEAAFYYAKGIAASAGIVSAWAAPQMFAAAAAMTAVAALAGVAAKAIGPVRKTIPDTAREEKAETRGTVGAGAREGGGGTVTYQNTFYILPGTDENRIGESIERTINSSRRTRGERRTDEPQDQREV